MEKIKKILKELDYKSLFYLSAGVFLGTDEPFLKALVISATVFVLSIPFWGLLDFIELKIFGRKLKKGGQDEQ